MKGVVVKKDPEEEERIRKRQAGTAVTAESFARWRDAFEAEERERAKGQGKSAGPGAEDRPTGKQLFLSNRAGLEEAILAAAENEAVVEGSEELTVNEDLFLEDVDDEDGEDLEEDDIEDEEEES